MGQGQNAASWLEYSKKKRDNVSLLGSDSQPFWTSSHRVNYAQHNPQVGTFMGFDDASIDVKSSTVSAPMPAAEKKRQRFPGDVAGVSDVDTEADIVESKQEVLAPYGTGFDARKAVDQRTGMDTNEDRAWNEKWIQGRTSGYYQ